MSSELGKNIHLTIFGQSHGKAIGGVIDGLPAGFEIDMDAVQAFLNRRAPGQNAFSTPRKESDRPEILSGLTENKTCGAPLAFMIMNQTQNSADYAALSAVPRPGHADYTARMRYGDAVDMRGGGHFSGRLTAPLCFAGAIAMQILAKQGIYVGAHIAKLGGIEDDAYDTVNLSKDQLSATNTFPVQNKEKGERMQEAILAAKKNSDSVGGIIECAAIGLPAGIGNPMFDGVENRLSAAIFGIPAVRGIAFGAGFSAADMFGSEHNDAFYQIDDKVLTRTNNHGGVLGGITSGMPLIFRVALKPTPSIGKVQESVDLTTHQNTELTVLGRHDPSIVPRAVPCVEAATAFVLLDFLKTEYQAD